MSDIEATKNMVRGSGIWNGRRESTHAFCLTTARWNLSDVHGVTLTKLGKALFGVLSALGRLAAISADNNLAKGSAWRLIRDVVHTEVPSYRHSLQCFKPSTPPLVFRVDMVEKSDGTLKIVEIEGDKTHGFGYSTLFRQIALAGGAAVFPGVVHYISEAVRHRSCTATLVVPEPIADRFYRPEMDILCQALIRGGIQVHRLQEENPVDVQDQSLLLSLPRFDGDTTRVANRGLEQSLIDRYQHGDLQVLIPPKSFLSSKGVMALLCNFSEDPDLEAILRSQIQSDHLQILRSFLPRTMFVAQGMVLPAGEWVLKHVHSSGAHGVFFSSDEVRFASAFKKACSGINRAIVQEVVASPTRSYAVYNQFGQGLGQQDRYARVAVFFARQGVADVTITACPRLPVHGGKGAVMVGGEL